MKLTVICDTFNESRYRPHRDIGSIDEIKYIKLNNAYHQPWKTPLIIFQLLITLFDNSKVFVDAAPLNPVVLYLIPLKFLKGDDLVYNSSYPYWEEDYRFMYGNISISVFERLWFFFLKGIKIRTVNSAAQDCLRKHTTADKCRLIPHSVDLGVFEPRQIQSDRFTCLFVGKVQNEKGIDHIIRLARDNPDKDFIIVGKGDDYKRIIQSDLKNLYVYGYVRDEKALNHLFNVSDAFILPSRRVKHWEELFGIVIIEAMATKTPVITTKCVGPSDIIDHQENGILVDIDDYNGLNEAVQRIAENPELRSRLTERAYLRVKEEYEVSVVADQIKDILEHD